MSMLTKSAAAWLTALAVLAAVALNLNQGPRATAQSAPSPVQKKAFEKPERPQFPRGREARAGLPRPGPAFMFRAEPSGPPNPELELMQLELDAMKEAYKKAFGHIIELRMKPDLRGQDRERALMSASEMVEQLKRQILEKAERIADLQRSRPGPAANPPVRGQTRPDAPPQGDRVRGRDRVAPEGQPRRDFRPDQKREREEDRSREGDRNRGGEGDRGSKPGPDSRPRPADVELERRPEADAKREADVKREAEAELSRARQAQEAAVRAREEVARARQFENRIRELEQRLRDAMNTLERQREERKGSSPAKGEPSAPSRKDQPSEDAVKKAEHREPVASPEARSKSAALAPNLNLDQIRAEIALVESEVVRAKDRIHWIAMMEDQDSNPDNAAAAEAAVAAVESNLTRAQDRLRWTELLVQRSEAGGARILPAYYRALMLNPEASQPPRSDPPAPVPDATPAAKPEVKPAPAPAPAAKPRQEAVANPAAEIELLQIELEAKRKAYENNVQFLETLGPIQDGAPPEQIQRHEQYSKQRDLLREEYLTLSRRAQELTRMQRDKSQSARVSANQEGLSRRLEEQQALLARSRQEAEEAHRQLRTTEANFQNLRAIRENEVNQMKQALADALAQVAKQREEHEKRGVEVQRRLQALTNERQAILLEERKADQPQGEAQSQRQIRELTERLAAAEKQAEQRFAQLMKAIEELKTNRPRSNNPQ